MSDRTAQIARQFTQGIPHARDLGMEIRHLENGVCEIEMPYDEKLIGDARTGVIHGGAISALMDTCSGAAVMSHPSNPGGTATLDLRIDYMRAATPGQTIRARAECYHVTHSVAFVRASACDDQEDPPVATAHGAFTLERKS
ncbi:PaaI family thioesterase [Palleronia abyssalis]|uniref:Thioesterase domain-containing protein n=1 Tax=Palleronia abyssalis TaxID=1501240 RepID=A0A2R8BU24_9RHOB|nr:PaaI family thioesterase [Palleronia abyssalis]SPJ23635.1 hypothetical protein PAA8504_01448 [Palleronia abyssalis]